MLKKTLFCEPVVGQRPARNPNTLGAVCGASVCVEADGIVRSMNLAAPVPELYRIAPAQGRFQQVVTLGRLGFLGL